MQPSLLLALLTQEQTAELLVGCCNYLSAERIAACLREGLEPSEVEQVRDYLVDLEADGE